MGIAFSLTADAKQKREQNLLCIWSLKQIGSCVTVQALARRLLDEPHARAFSIFHPQVWAMSYNPYCLLAPRRFFVLPAKVAMASVIFSQNFGSNSAIHGRNGSHACTVLQAPVFANSRFGSSFSCCWALELSSPAYNIHLWCRPFYVSVTAHMTTSIDLQYCRVPKNGGRRSQPGSFLCFTTLANIVLIFQPDFKSPRLACSAHTVRADACRAAKRRSGVVSKSAMPLKKSSSQQMLFACGETALNSFFQPGVVLIFRWNSSPAVLRQTVLRHPTVL